MKNYELLVIGGGPVGITLAKMLGKKFKMAVIRPEDYSMIYCAMPYAVEGLLSEEKTLKKDSLVIDSGSDLIRGTVKSVDFKNNLLCLEDNSQISYKKLVIATGAVPLIPNIQGSTLPEVTSFKTQKDMEKINTFISKGASQAIVVGAGAIGIELAQSLKNRGLDVHLIDMQESILPGMMDSDMVSEAAKTIEDSGIKLHLNSRVTTVKGHNNVSGAVLDKNSSAINIDFNSPGKGFIVFAVGMKPETGLFKGSGLEMGSQGIIINSKMETNIPDVYAAGDCTQFKSGITGVTVPGKLATNAVPMAKVLGFNLLGDNREYPGFFNGAATKVNDYYVGGTGINSMEAEKNKIEVIQGSSELTSRFPIMPGAEKIKLKIIADKKDMTIIGAQVTAKQPVTDKIDLLTFAIQSRAHIKDLTSLSYSAQPWQSFFPAANLVVLAAEDILKKVK